MLRWAFLLVLSFGAVLHPARGQEVRADTVATAPPDTVRTVPNAEGGLSEPVRFAARDSLVLAFGGPLGDVARLVGEAEATYGARRLEAAEIQILLDRDELRARGLPSDTGLVGTPVFSEGEESFTGRELAFNLRTERGRVVGARTLVEDGIINAGVVKVLEDSTIYIQDGIYTTCECGPGETPSYSLRAARMKIVDQRWIYTGPIQLYLFNIPTPLWLPFGFIPAQEGRRSGPLPPQYGEDERGFYLRNLGWYWAISPYMDLQVRAGLWTRGSWEVAPLFRYARRYRYTGQVQLDYVKSRRGERDDPDFTLLNTASLRWNHNQTLSPTADFGADVDLSTQGYLRTVSEQYDDRVRQTIQSSIRYNKRWPAGGRSLSLSTSQQQVLATGEANLTLPQLRFTQSTRKPFARRTRRAGQAERWYERLSVSYTGTLSNQYAFRPLPDDTLRARGDTAAVGIAWYEALVRPDRFRRATGGAFPFTFRALHTVPLSAPFNVERFPFTRRPFRLTVAPAADYAEEWFVRTQRRRLDERGRVVTDEVGGFFALRRFSASLSAGTTLYGLFPWQLGALRGLRHTLRPTLSASYAPDFNTDFWGYTRTYTDTTGRVVRYPIVSSGLGTEQRAVNLSLANVFETKRVRTDTTGAEQSQTLTLLNLDLVAGYNFAADSLRLSPIGVSARTRLFDDLNLNLTASFSPYATTSDGTTVVDRYLFSLRDLRFARLTNLSASASFSFRSGRAGVSQPLAVPRARLSASPLVPGGTPPLDVGDPFAAPYYNTAVGYADFAIPWSLNVDFSYNYSNPFGLRAQRTATVNTAFDFNLTPRWKVQGRSGFDFVQGEIVTTSLVLLRDFDCWEMSFSWVPFGAYQSYSFDLHVKSGKLRDLLRLRQPRSDVRGRFGDLLR